MLPTSPSKAILGGLQYSCNINIKKKIIALDRGWTRRSPSSIILCVCNDEWIYSAELLVNFCLKGELTTSCQTSRVSKALGLDYSVFLTSTLLLNTKNVSPLLLSLNKIPKNGSFITDIHPMLSMSNSSQYLVKYTFIRMLDTSSSFHSSSHKLRGEKTKH